MANDNESAWARETMARFEGPLVRYAAQITGAVEPAREVVQEVFLRMWKTGSAKIGHYVAPWLFTVTRNLAFDVRKKEKRMTPLFDIDLAPSAASGGGAHDGLERQESDRALATAMNRLNERQREVIRLKFQNGLSYKEIAQVTGLSTSNVGVLIHTGVKVLRETLTKPASRAAQGGEA